MAGVQYAWDEAKAAANLAKHGISFTAAARALEDPRKVKSSMIDLNMRKSEFRISAYIAKKSYSSSLQCRRKTFAAS